MSVSCLRPLAMVAISSAVNRLFRSILRVSCSDRGVDASKAFPLPFRPVPGGSDREGNCIVACDGNSDESTVLRALDKRLRRSASSSIALTSFSTSRSEPSVARSRDELFNRETSLIRAKG